MNDERPVSKMEGKTNFLRRLKQFDGLTCWPPLFYDRSTPLVGWVCCWSVFVCLLISVLPGVGQVREYNGHSQHHLHVAVHARVHLQTVRIPRQSTSTTQLTFIHIVSVNSVIHSDRNYTTPIGASPAVMSSETVGLRTRPVGDQKTVFW